MTEDEPTGEVKASATGQPWPDPSRPIVNQRPPGFGGRPPTVGTSRPPFAEESAGPRWRAMIVVVLVVLVVALVTVWLLWWR